MKVYIKSCGLSKFGKSNRRLMHIIEDAVEDMNVSLENIDAVYIGLMNPEAFTGVGNIASYTADKLGLDGVPSVRIETASSTGAAVFYQAYAAIRSGLYKNILVLAAEKMTHLPTPEVTKIISEVIDPVERKTGASMPALAALVTNRFMYENKISLKKMQEALASVAVKSHYYGHKNPIAQFQKLISKDHYMDSKLVSDPLRLYDCSPISDGAAAVVISCEDGPVEIAGIGQGTDKQAICKRGSLTAFLSTRKAASEAYSMSGLGPSDIDFTEMHDAFTPFEIMGLAECGLVPVEKLLEFYKNNEGYHNGSLPVNISGGLKSRGHPVGASGLAQIAECFRIMTGRYPEDITPKKTDICLTHSIGGLATNNFVTILKKKGFEPKEKSSSYIFREPKIYKYKDKRYRIFSSTRLYSPPKGFESPLDIVILQRKDRLHLAKSASEELPPIGGMVHLNEKTEGRLVVEKDSILHLLGFKKK